MIERKKYFLILLLIVIGSLEILAQTPPPSAPPSAGAPLDGFSFSLLALGAAYGIKGIRKTVNQ